MVWNEVLGVCQRRCGSSISYKEFFGVNNFKRNFGGGLSSSILFAFFLLFMFALNYISIIFVKKTDLCLTKKLTNTNPTK